MFRKLLRTAWCANSAAGRPNAQKKSGWCAVGGWLLVARQRRSPSGSSSRHFLRSGVVANHFVEIVHCGFDVGDAAEKKVLTRGARMLVGVV